VEGGGRLVAVCCLVEGHFVTVCCVVEGGHFVTQAIFLIVFVRFLKIKMACFLVSNLNSTSRKIKLLSISKTNRLILYRDMIYVYSENSFEHKNVDCWVNVEAVDLEVRCAYSERLS
jgi:hypothetical protein